MCDYQKQAMDFLAITGTTLKITFKEKRLTDFIYSKKALHNVYVFTLQNANGVYQAEFTDSIHNTENGKAPTEYDILACLYLSNCTNLSEFCDDFGYDKHERKAQAIYKKVKKQDEGLTILFNEEQLDLLAEIN